MKNTTIPSDKKERNNWGATEEDEILLKRSGAEFAELGRDRHRGPIHARIGRDTDEADQDEPRKANGLITTHEIGNPSPCALVLRRVAVGRVQQEIHIGYNHPFSDPASSSE